MSGSHGTWFPWAALARCAAVLRWGLRTYPLVVAACVLALGVSVPLVAGTAPTYQAEVPVVARELRVDPVALPSYGRAIFASDAMVQRLAAETSLSNPADALAAGRLEVVIDKDSIVLVVLARAPEPSAAARLADRVAAAYVVELNKGGDGIGSFLPQGKAPVPASPINAGPSTLLLAALGVAAGALLALSGFALLAALRRPLLQSSDVKAATGRPVIGVVTVPHHRAGRPIDHHEVPGLVLMARVLLPLVDGSVVLASTPEDAATRRRLLVLLALALSPFRAIFVSASPRLQAAVAQRLPGSGSKRATAVSGPGLELIDGTVPADVLEVPQWRLPVILVIRYGAPVARLRHLAADNAAEEILGVVMVDEGRSLQRWRDVVTTRYRRTNQAGHGTDPALLVTPPSPETPTVPSVK